VLGGHHQTLVFVGLCTFFHAFAYNVLQGGVFSAVVIAILVMASPDIGPNTQDTPDFQRALCRSTGLCFSALFSI
jgi:hypothetical protein